MKRLKLTLLLTTVFAACGTEQSNTTPSPQTDPGTQNEASFQSGDETPTNRAAAREAIAEYARQKLPDWNIKGVATIMYSGNQYIGIVEVEKSERHEFLTLYTTNFFAKDGSSHWAAQAADDSVQNIVHNAEDVKINKQLRANKGESEPNER
jgi:hypothetical protein